MKGVSKRDWYWGKVRDVGIERMRGVNMCRLGRGGGMGKG